MNRPLFTWIFALTFLLGALGVTWVGLGFFHTSFMALLMTALIGAVYGFGALELWQFRKATATLTAALAAIPDDLPTLDDWLRSVHPSLQHAVRLRIEGERIGLAGPALTPYLVGLLVMLGMLGTFLGMVVTLNGAVFALEKTTDLQAIRSALAVPVRGLGMAFGTSVAGVAASAMLGLMSALCRRERMQAGQFLDGRIATVLRRFSLTHLRLETFRTLQLQSLALPGVVDGLQTMMVRMEDMHRRLGAELSQHLLGNQERFHHDVKVVYTDLASAVDRSLRESLTKGAQAAGDSIRPVVEAAMNGITREAATTHLRMAETVQQQFDGLSTRLAATAESMSRTWTAALVSHEQASERIVDGVERSLDGFSQTFAQRSGALVSTVGDTYARLQADRDAHADQTLAQTTRLVSSAEALMQARIASEAGWIEQHHDRMDQMAGLLRTELGALREEEALRGAAAVERLGQLQSALATHLTTLGTALEEPITRLITTASEAPRAAAEVISQLRGEITSSVARDNALLEERTRIMETLNALLEAIHHASAEQRAVIGELVTSSAVALDTAGTAFSENVDTQTTRLADIAASVTTSAVEVSSLSEAFGFAVHAFGEANEKLIVNLQRIEGAMDKSMSRSDEQLAYYVAQAREIIDLSMASHKEIVEGLRQQPARNAALAQESS